MDNLGLNIIKYTVGFPILIVATILGLFKILIIISTNDRFAVYEWRQLIKMWKLYTFENLR